jgi:hypothetical protein
MSKALKTEEVINLIKKGKSVDDIVLSDIRQKRVQFREAMLLADNGYVIPEENILYDDSDIMYDPDFDEVEWEGNYNNLQSMLLSQGVFKAENAADKITIELLIEDEELKDWLVENTTKLKDLVRKLVVDLYHTEKILHSK